MKLRTLLILFVSAGFSMNVNADTSDPCGGPNALLNIIDRPTVADSACVVPFKQVVVEAGYQYQHLTHSGGNAENLPQAEFRLGLPANNEFAVVFPNSIQQWHNHQYGSSATTMGVKHELGYNSKWVGAIEALATLPDGSAVLGSKRMGIAANGIVGYTYNSKFNISFMFGVSSQSESSQNNGHRFTSINPDLVLTYSPTDKLDIYAEFYGQSKTASNEGSGFNLDAGFLYLLLPNLSVDLEAGQRMSGNLGGFAHYVGAGIGILFL